MTSPSATNTALAESELKTCPFCDGKPKGAYDDNTGSWEIFCTGCGCTMMAITEADCASWWNGRAFQSKDDDAAREIARLRAALKPFAKAADQFRGNEGYEFADVRIGDLRKARAAIQTDGATDG